MLLEKYNTLNLDFMDFTKPWTEQTFVAFDLETSGGYALGYDIVEFGAVKWSKGQEVDRLQLLFKPRTPMSDFIIKIHGITNEMVEGAPFISEKIQEIRDFFNDSILMAHHAPFDMGFIQADFEKHKVIPPKEPVICTSLLARKLITESPNHKLQTLIKVLKLDGGQAHRGLDDARACLQLGLICMQRLGDHASLNDVFKSVGKLLHWNDFSINDSKNENIIQTAKAIQKGAFLQLIYLGGSVKTSRRIKPIGIVRNPDGDYVQAICLIDRVSKRFYFDKMVDLSIVDSD
jgi:DNA polymerase-3 subunit epsilon